MRVVCILLSIAIIATILIDAFETILQPRRVTHRWRFARFFYRNAWMLWRAAALRIAPGKRREAFLGIFGPLSLLALFTMWVIALVFAFGLLFWSLRTRLATSDNPVTFLTYVYFSGSAFFTLGYGDVMPAATLGRAMIVVEAGLGFAFLAVIIAYLPVLYQAYSKREATISLLDARAGSPPSAAEALLRSARSGDNLAAIDSFLAEWERWAAELLESHLSFPVLSYYRSQHDNQSWLAALTVMLDASALLLAEVKSQRSYQAQLTFAIARHAAVDLCLVLKAPPRTAQTDRLSDSERQRLRALLAEADVKLHEEKSGEKLTGLRAMYEPFVSALADRFVFTLPPILPPEVSADNWQRSAWMAKTPGIGSLPSARPDDGHFS